MHIIYGLKTPVALFVYFACCVMLMLPVKSFAASTLKGKGVYDANCASCHGESGSSVMLDAPNFDQGESLYQSDLNLLDAIRNGKNAMPAYRGILSDSEILDVIAYLRTLN